MNIGTKLYLHESFHKYFYKMHFGYMTKYVYSFLRVV